MATTINLGVIRHRIGDNGNWFLGDTDTGFTATGADGAEGVQGKPGETGADGKSAYELAVDNGFEGTLSEWLTSITAIEITAYSAWQSWREADPVNNVLAFDDWVSQRLREYPFSSEEIGRMKARLAWEAAQTGVEYWTGGYHIDGRKIYGKIIDFGALPNNTSKSVAHKVANLNEAVSFYGTTSSGSNIIGVPYSYSSPISLDVNKDSLIIITSKSWSGWSTTRIKLLYTCTDR